MTWRKPKKKRKKLPIYHEDLIMAVKYLYDKGITKSSEIAKRLDLSPYTVRNIKKILRERGLITPEGWEEAAEREGQVEERQPQPQRAEGEKQKKRPRTRKRRDVLAEILGLEG